MFMALEFRQALALALSENLPLHEAEERIIGADHTLVGAMLAKRWQFPDYLVDCIAGHHGPAYPTSLAECLHVADLIAERLGYDSNGNISAGGGPWALPERFGGDLDAVIALLGDMSKLIEEAQQFSRAGQ